MPTDREALALRNAYNDWQTKQAAFDVIQIEYAEARDAAIAAGDLFAKRKEELSDAAIADTPA